MGQIDSRQRALQTREEKDVTDRHLCLECNNCAERTLRDAGQEASFDAAAFFQMDYVHTMPGGG